MSLLAMLHDKFNAVFSRCNPSQEQFSSPRQTSTSKRAHIRRADPRTMDQAMDFSYSTSCESTVKRKRGPCDSMSPLKLQKTAYDDSCLYRDGDGDILMLDDDDTWPVGAVHSDSWGLELEDEHKQEEELSENYDAEEDNESYTEDTDAGDHDTDSLEDDEADADHAGSSNGSENESEGAVDDEYSDRDLQDEDYEVAQQQSPSDHSDADDEPANTTSFEDSLLDYTETPSKIYPSIEPPSLSDDLSTTLAIKRVEGWDEAHLSLLYHLHSRGREPVLPSSFQTALHFMPSNLFTTSDQHAFLDAHHTSSFHGERNLTRLLRLGGYMRSSQQDNAKPEKQLKRFLKPYQHWALKDTGLAPGTSLPVVAIVTANDCCDPSTLEAKTQKVLRRLVSRHRQALEPAALDSCSIMALPTCYALVGFGTHVLLIARRPDQDDALQIVADYDFGHKEHDVWNALALALVVCHGRDVQIQISAELGHDAGGARDQPADDPDA